MSVLYLSEKKECFGREVCPGAVGQARPGAPCPPPQAPSGITSVSLPGQERRFVGKSAFLINPVILG